MSSIKDSEDHILWNKPSICFRFKFLLKLCPLSLWEECREGLGGVEMGEKYCKQRSEGQYHHNSWNYNIEISAKGFFI